MRIILRLLTFLRPYWWVTCISLTVILTLTFLRLGPAWFIKLIIDNAVKHNDIMLAIGLAAALFGVSLATNGMSALDNYLQQWIGQRVVYDLRKTLYRKLQQQSMSFFDENQTGALMSRLTNDVSQVQTFLTQGIERFVMIIVAFFVYLAVLLSLDVQLTLLSMVVGPIILFFQWRQMQMMPLHRIVLRKLGDLDVIIQENVAGIKTVKAFGREHEEAQRFDDANQAIRSNRLKIQWNQAFVSPGQELATVISSIIVLVFGAQRVIDGSLSLGSLVVFQVYVAAMWQPIRWINFTNNQAQQALASGERIFEILDTPQDVAEPVNATDIPALKGGIRLENVSFAYGKNPPLLQNIDVDIQPGQTVALVGPSGSGKTTLINLIPRFYDVTKGRVLVDGHDVREVKLESLRSQIGMVMQETFLFNMTVAENISYGRSDVSREQIIEAAKIANAHDFICEFPEGYETMIGERGVKLSGGQRQRLSIARAILVDPRILILDEATSSVDTRTDLQIQQALDRLMQNRTSIVIAHRLSTVRRADLILVMQDGKIVARGTHDDLLENSPLYQQIYELQFQFQSRSDLSASDTIPSPNGNGIIQPSDSEVRK